MNNTKKKSPSHPNRIVQRKEVLDLVGMSVSQMDRLEKVGNFPGRIKLSERRVGWSLYELEKWIEENKAKRSLNTNHCG